MSETPLTRRRFLARSAATGAVVLAGADEASARALSPGPAAAAAKRRPTKAGKMFGNLLRRVKDSYPDKTTFRLLEQVAASPVTTNKMVDVAFGLLGNYTAVGSTHPQPIPPSPALGFPAENKQHYRVQTEWYYLSMSLKLDNGALVSIVATFFRSPIGSAAAIGGVAPLDQQMFNTSIGITVQDLPGSRDAHYAVPTTSFYPPTGGVRISTSPFELTVGKNSLKGGRDVFPLRVRLVNDADPSIGLPRIDVNVTCAATNPRFLQGQDGYVGAEGFASFYYYSWPQQQTSGTVTIGGKRHGASGITWADHQWGANPAPARRSPPIPEGGWSWFEFQFDGNRSLTFAFPHKPLQNGRLPFTPITGIGTYVDGRSPTFLLASVTIPKGSPYVRSPLTKALYPTQWVVETKTGPSIRVIPTVAVEPSTDYFASFHEYSEAACTAVATFADGSTMNGVGVCETVGMEAAAHYKARAVAYLKAGLRRGR
jgi:predicted secreted hydrolase